MKSLVLIGALLTSECAFLVSPASGDIQFFLIGEPSTGGSTLVIRLSNESDRALTYNLCFSSARFEGDRRSFRLVTPSFTLK